MISIYNPSLFIKLNESEKRIVFVIFLVIIIALMIIAAIGMIIQKVMKSQAKRIENDTFDAVTNNLLPTKKTFKKYANKKNKQILLKQAWVPIILIIVGFVTLLIRNAITKNFSYNPFNNKDGFSTLLWLWDFNNPENYTKIFLVPFKVLKQWPPLINEPHLVKEAWGSYVFVPFVCVGGFWYLLISQAYLARKLKINKLAKSIYDKNLSNYKINQGYVNNPEQK